MTYITKNANQLEQNFEDNQRVTEIVGNSRENGMAAGVGVQGAATLMSW